MREYTRNEGRKMLEAIQYDLALVSDIVDSCSLDRVHGMLTGLDKLGGKLELLINEYYKEEDTQLRFGE